MLAVGTKMDKCLVGESTFNLNSLKQTEIHNKLI